MKRRILYNCECGGEARISFEHNIDCPYRVGFFGAPIEWGVGEYGEIRVNKDKVWIYTGQTWEREWNMRPADVIKKDRKKKLKNLEKYGKKSI